MIKIRVKCVIVNSLDEAEIELEVTGKTTVKYLSIKSLQELGWASKNLKQLSVKGYDSDSIECTNIPNDIDFDLAAKLQQLVINFTDEVQLNYFI